MRDAEKRCKAPTRTDIRNDWTSLGHRPLGLILAYALLMLSLLMPLSSPHAQTEPPQVENDFLVLRLKMRQNPEIQVDNPIQRFRVDLQLRLHSEREKIGYGFVRGYGANGFCVDNCTDGVIVWLKDPTSWKEEILHVDRNAIWGFIGKAYAAGYTNRDKNIFLDITVTPITEHSVVTGSTVTVSTFDGFRPLSGMAHEVSQTSLHERSGNPLQFTINLSERPDDNEPRRVTGTLDQSVVNITDFGWRTSAMSYTALRTRYETAGGDGSGPLVSIPVGNYHEVVTLEPTHQIHAFNRVIQGKIDGDLDPDELNINSLGRSETDATKKDK